jgi:hypothetical protein
LILDEAAHMADADSGAAHEAEEIYRALLPSLSQFAGRAPVIVSSTPAGDANWFAGMVSAGLAGELEHGRAHTAASADMNPTLDAGFLAAEERRDPEGFRGEYLAELVGSGGSFLDPELIENNVAGRGELDPGDADGWVCEAQVQRLARLAARRRAELSLRADEREAAEAEQARAAVAARLEAIEA